MTPAPLHVLLLGWNDAPRAGEQPVPAIRPLVDILAPHAALSVMVPHQPQPAISSTATTRVTSLTDLTPAEARTTRPDGPAAWQQPAAPYVGSGNEQTANGASGGWGVPAAPYQGATPDLAGAAPNVALPNALNLSHLEERPAVVDQRATRRAVEASIATAGELEEETLQEQPVSGFIPEEREVAEAPGQTVAELTPADQPAPARTNLVEALAALGVDLAPDADLNFQVIQYARFATRRALLEDFAVIYAADWPTWLAALEIRQQTGRPLVLHVHSLAQERATPADRGWALELERLALRRADMVLAASDEVAHLLRVRYNVAPERLQLVDPTDTETLNTVLHQLEHSLTGRQPVVPFFPPTA
ncbi:glycosyltransferase family 4 protein [Hymenobacter swuensis]|uniref:Glycosyltransferase subfamily 4-like N-terminal domain-containing protein n=1 Tax=Hymenobacter swuensis DY53 TaxID=1227739 RepID=W8F1Z1_9BACT|nr:glycosyltransferase [Hymenobacter swuensis]AHJ96611.1 hypothetical protein Hsw_1016 [Hymenobacter swuensis DY53]